MHGDDDVPLRVSIGQARALAEIADRAGDDWIFGRQPIDDEMVEHHDLELWREGDLLHVSMCPPFERISLSAKGELVGRRRLNRAEVMTVALRAGRGWAGMRRLLRERGIDPYTTILADAFDDDEDIDVGVLITEDASVIKWRRHYSDDDHGLDRILDWQTITGAWQGTGWATAVQDALALLARRAR